MAGGIRHAEQPILGQDMVRTFENSRYGIRESGIRCSCREAGGKFSRGFACRFSKVFWMSAVDFEPSRTATPSKVGIQARQRESPTSSGPGAGL